MAFTDNLRNALRKPVRKRLVKADETVPAPNALPLMQTPPGCLSPSQRLRIAQLWLCGFDTAEIAEQMKLPEAAVYNALDPLRETGLL